MIARKIASLFTLLGSMYLAGIVGYWSGDRDVPVQAEAIEVIRQPSPGGQLVIRWGVRRMRACASKRQEIFIDSENVRWVLGAQILTGPPGPLGDDTFMTRTEIPQEVPLGDAILRVIVTYTCNPIHQLWPIIDTSIQARVVVGPPDQAQLRKGVVQ